VEHRATGRRSDSARLRPCPPTAFQDANRAVITRYWSESKNLRLIVISADTLWPVHRRHSRNRPRLSQPKGRKQKPSRYSLNRHVAQRLTVVTTTHRDHCARHREHIHVSPAAHPNCDALAGPILIRLPTEVVGIVSQGKIRFHIEYHITSTTKQFKSESLSVVMEVSGLE
jgi:hypothetical protein